MAKPPPPVAAAEPAQADAALIAAALDAAAERWEAEGDLVLARELRRFGHELQSDARLSRVSLARSTRVPFT